MGKSRKSKKVGSNNANPNQSKLDDDNPTKIYDKDTTIFISMAHMRHVPRERVWKEHKGGEKGQQVRRRMAQMRRRKQEKGVDVEQMEAATASRSVDGGVVVNKEQQAADLLLHTATSEIDFDTPTSDYGIRRPAPTSDYGIRRPAPSSFADFTPIWPVQQLRLYKQFADVKKQTVFFLQTADVWSTSSAAEACRCGPQTADVLASKKQTPP
ncbi:hypothetical protein LXL04_010123 [Taraxacum kok-saghyz]